MDHIPTLGANNGFLIEKMKTILELMVKKMLRIKAQQLRKVLK